MPLSEPPKVSGIKKKHLILQQVQRSAHWPSTFQILRQVKENVFDSCIFSLGAQDVNPIIYIQTLQMLALAKQHYFLPYSRELCTAVPIKDKSDCQTQV